ncbi:MAG: glycerol-3-phosphate acyltransferase, partial [Vicinamibacteria bacterium]|nr:glycerol-3-phosphate acyltransferase [Vicinamibacteria bacterium]
MSLAVLALLGYGIGSIPFSFLVARLFGVKDVRTVGSGNVGATNVMRSAGAFPGVAALILDGSKGAV